MDFIFFRRVLGQCWGLVWISSISNTAKVLESLSPIQLLQRYMSIETFRPMSGKFETWPIFYYFKLKSKSCS